MYTLYIYIVYVYIYIYNISTLFINDWRFLGCTSKYHRAKPTRFNLKAVLKS